MKMGLANGFKAIDIVASEWSQRVIFQGPGIPSAGIDVLKDNELKESGLELTAAPTESGNLRVPSVIADDRGPSVIFDGSDALISWISMLTDPLISRKLSVVHVGAYTVDSDLTGMLRSDAGDLASMIRNLGFCILSGESVQELHDLAIIAHVASRKCQKPIVNLFDGILATSQMETLKRAGSIGDFASDDDFTSLDPADAVKNAMTLCNRHLHRPYRIFEFIGPSTADMVIVVPGWVSASFVEAVRARVSNQSTDKKLCRFGVLRIHLLHPWRADDFVNALPAQVTRVCVIDCAKDKEYDCLVFRDVIGSYVRYSHLTRPLLISGSVIPCSVQRVPRATVEAVIGNLIAQDPLKRFVIDLVDKRNDLAGVKLNIDASNNFLSLQRQFVFWSNITPGPLCDSWQAIGMNVVRAGLEAQALSAYRTEVKISPLPSFPNNGITNADLIICDSPATFSIVGVETVKQLGHGKRLLVAASWKTPQDVEKNLSSLVRSHLVSKNVELYALDVDFVGNSNPDLTRSFLDIATARLAESPFSDFRSVSFHLLKQMKEVLSSSEFAMLEGFEVDEALCKIDCPESWKSDQVLSSSLSNLANSFGVEVLPEGMKQKVFNFKETPGVDKYGNVLASLFEEGLTKVNAKSEFTNMLNEVTSTVNRSIASCFGSRIAKSAAREKVVAIIDKQGSEGLENLSQELMQLLTKWRQDYQHGTADGNSELTQEIIDLLDTEKESSLAAASLYEHRDAFVKSSKWIIGDDNWAFDLSTNGIHQIVSSNEDINVLVLDNSNYSSGHIPKMRQDKRWKDIGLYAMNYGTAYVASVSILASPSQTVQALKEADAFKGPSIVLAHYPRIEMDVSSEELARLSVDGGHWPLYRWNPELEEEFASDSKFLKAEIKAFLDREQNLSMLANAAPDVSSETANGSLLEKKYAERSLKLMEEAKRKRAQREVDSLLDGLSPDKKKQNLNLLVLYGSDGGHASQVAESLAKKVEIGGYGEARCIEANDFALDSLEEESHVLFVLATAGQGEACANANSFTTSLSKYNGNLTKLKYAVFGLGDSAYWGKDTAESAKYFCLNAREIDERLSGLGAVRQAPIGLGDDQADDGYNEALGEWEHELWKVLDVDVPAGNVSEAPELIDDDIKIKSNYLRGMISEGLQDLSTGKLIPEDTKITKFHGIYQQDLRSVREERDAAGLERAYSFMIRIGVPGGVATSEQYIMMDDLCNQYANGVVKLTTRQAYQFHGVLKKNLKQTMKGINRATMDTLAACGDVSRNIIANPHHRNSGLHREVHQLAVNLQSHLRPKTSAYAEVWLDKKPVAGSVDHEPIYGITYLPRKFKIAIAVPPINDVDVFAHCLGFIAIAKDGKLLGYNVCVGGGMGTTHGNKATYPRLSDLLGFCNPNDAIAIAEAIVVVQRDHGERLNRKHARLKYTVEDMGLSVFRSKVEAQSGVRLQEPHLFKFTTNADPYGWHQSPDGTWEYTLFVENGYIKDTPEYRIKTALREIAENHPNGEFNLTSTQNLIIGNVSPKRKPHIEKLFRKYGIDNTQWSAMRLHSMACVALPTCALAMAESQRYLPSLITKIEKVLDRCGLRHDAITIRMTGCPNGCARPAMAEIGLIGKAMGQYNLYLGGGFAGNRLSKMYREGVNEEQILQILDPLLESYSHMRYEKEHFGDFCIRSGVIEPTLEGRLFWSYGDENVSNKPIQVYW